MTTLTEPAITDPLSVLTEFTAPVASWFRRSFAEPSCAQVQAWPTIRRGENTLLLAPTGSGKTLAAFLCAIDDLVRKAGSGDLTDAVHVLYVTPLKALGNDIHKNLTVPLLGIQEEAGGALPEIRAAVRTGDTPQAERAAMAKRPPHILITTPESLYLLLQSSSMAPALLGVRTVIVDEVHALCGSKRGTHLAVSLERLQAMVGRPIQRIGCSATLSPLEEIAAYLVGCEADGSQRPCAIVDAGMRKDLDVQVAAPLPDFLEAGHAALWNSAYDRLLREAAQHDTTLIFCNSRYKAERTVLRLRESAGDRMRIGVHHGSMSKEMRLEAEDDLKSGRLDALVATASLELGIDIGAVDLVYQLESPKSVATGLQRVGRAGHLLNATSKGRLLVFERDELLEAAAICRAMLAGAVDRISIPRGCLDVLAQQIAGAVAVADWRAEELLALIRRAYPYTDLSREAFESVVGMLAGEFPFEMARPPRPLLLWDRAADRLSPTRSTAHVCAMNVGTISENAEYEVVIAEKKRRVGTVQSEFVDDSLRAGDVFVLGSSSWRVVGVRRNQLLVEEAPGTTPTVPWWLGPVESRTGEVGRGVGQLRREIARRLDEPDLAAWLQAEYRLCPNGAAALIDYVREQRAAGGVVPDEQHLLVETWRDELGRVNIILHSPYGARINRTWGTAMAAAAKARWHEEWSVTASNDVVLLSRSEAHTPAKAGAAALLAAVGADNLVELIAASAAGAAAFGSAFREAAVCAFQVLRAWQGKRVPLWLQTHRAQELAEVAASHRTYPVVAEVLRAYLHDTLDVPGLAEVLHAVSAGQVSLTFAEVESPSPFAHSVLIADRYRDDHQMGRERRAHLLRLHRQVLQEVLSAEEMAQLLDARAIEGLERRLSHRSEATQARTSDELAQAIRDLGDLPATLDAIGGIVDGDAAALLAPLLADYRVVAVRLPECDETSLRLVSAEQWQLYHDAFGHHHGSPLLLPQLEGNTLSGFAEGTPKQVLPARLRVPVPPEQARAAVLERYLRCRGPVTVYEAANHTGWPALLIEEILDGLVAEGKAARGVYTSDKPRPQWINRANLEEIHRLTMGYLRRELAACAPYEVVDFVTRWQHLHPATRLRGIDGLREVIRQLQGYESLQGALEREIFGARVADYRPEMLDKLIAAGEVRWCRANPHRMKRGAVTLCLRRDMEWLQRGAPTQYSGLSCADADIPEVIGAARAYFAERGTAFFDDLVADTGCEEGALARAVWHLAWCGEITCDTYECLRHADFQTSLSACYDLDSTPRKIVQGRMSQDRVLKQMARRRLDPRLGRWSATPRLVPPGEPMSDSDVVARWAEQLLLRWGIVTRDIVDAEVAAPSWGELVRELKRLELLGKVSRGYYIESHHGEQYGVPEAVELLRECRARRSDTLGYLPDEPLYTLTNRDPANLYASSLEIHDERGAVVERSVKTGNMTIRLVAQAGQVLLYRDRQMVTLDRQQLTRVIETLKRHPNGDLTEVRFRSWNGLPIDTNPVAAVLHACGFRLDGRREMAWPPSRVAVPPPQVTQEEVFPAAAVKQHAQPEYSLDWFLNRASDQMRETFRLMFQTVTGLADPARWEFRWHQWGLLGFYRGVRVLSTHAGKTFLQLNFQSAVYQENGAKRRIHRRIRAQRAEDVNEIFTQTIRLFVEQVERHTDLSIAQEEERRTAGKCR